MIHNYLGHHFRLESKQLTQCSIHHSAHDPLRCHLSRAHSLASSTSLIPVLHSEWPSLVPKDIVPGTTSNDHYEQLEPHPVDDPYLCLGDVVRSLAFSLLDLRRHHQQQQSSTQDAHAPYDCCPQQSRGWILTNRRSRACSYCLQTSTGTNDLSVEPKAPSTIDFGARRHGSTL